MFKFMIEDESMRHLSARLLYMHAEEIAAYEILKKKLNLLVNNNTALVHLQTSKTEHVENNLSSMLVNRFQRISNLNQYSARMQQHGKFQRCQFRNLHEFEKLKACYLRELALFSLLISVETNDNVKMSLLSDSSKEMKHLIRFYENAWTHLPLNLNRQNVNAFKIDNELLRKSFDSNRKQNKNCSVKNLVYAVKDNTWERLVAYGLFPEMAKIWYEKPKVGIKGEMEGYARKKAQKCLSIKLPGKFWTRLDISEGNSVQEKPKGLFTFLLCKVLVDDELLVENLDDKSSHSSIFKIQNEAHVLPEYLMIIEIDYRA